MFQYNVECLFPSDVSPAKDVYLGETSVQIEGFHGSTSVYLVQSYMLADGHDIEHDTGSFYHIFLYKAGTTAVNYGMKEFSRVSQFIQLNNNWNVFYQDQKGDGLLPIPKENFLPSHHTLS